MTGKQEIKGLNQFTELGNLDLFSSDSILPNLSSEAEKLISLLGVSSFFYQPNMKLDDKDSAFALIDEVGDNIKFLMIYLQILKEFQERLHCLEVFQQL